MMMLTTSMMKPPNIQRHLFMIHQADIYECGLNNIAILEDLNTIMVILRSNLHGILEVPILYGDIDCEYMNCIIERWSIDGIIHLLELEQVLG